jgi:hypothetical protein
MWRLDLIFLIDASNIYYKGHWKGWALKIETFFGLSLFLETDPSPYFLYYCTMYTFSTEKELSTNWQV